MRKRSLSFSPLEKIFLAVFAALFFFSGAGLLRAFYIENTNVQPAFGGVLTEGMVGSMNAEFNLNPLFAEGISGDAASLVFAGLMRFNAETREIEDYLATHTLSPEKTVYEFTIKENVLWHDGQPVTANDILFTYRDVIQNDAFPGLLLKKAFEDVIIERVDERTVRFTIPEKRKTFFTNFTVGLLPRHQLAGIPVEELISAPFNQNPIGCGPYRFDGISPSTDFTTLRFSSFPEYFAGKPNIQTIEFRIFPTEEQLVAYLPELDAVRPMQSREADIIPENARLKSPEVISPRYLGVFFNMKDNTLVTKQIRQAMRAAINTTTIAEKHKGERVDTPLVELWPQNDIVNVSLERAKELLKEAGYSYPSEQEEIEEITPSTPEPEAEQPKTSKYVTEPSGMAISVVGSSEVFIIGSFPEETQSVQVNGYTLQQFDPSTGRFSYRAATDIKTLSLGENTYEIRFLNDSGELIDSEEITLLYETDSEKRKELQNGLSLLIDTGKPEREITTTAAEVSITENEERSEAEDEEEEESQYRVNSSGEQIELTLIHLGAFDYLGDIANTLQASWEEIGIKINTESLSIDDFRSRISTRDYDLILMPEDLGYNLDPYPYFHLSQAGEGGLNFSDWKNLKASLLMEEIRRTHDPEERLDSLLQLRDIIIDDVPAIFLFTPKYVWFYDTKVKNVAINHLALLSDRYSRVERFYIREERAFAEEKHVADFFSWLMQKTVSTFSLSHSE